MKKSFWQEAQPHVLAIGIFLIVSIFFCMPALQGLVVNQHDMLGWKAGAQQSYEYAYQHGQFPLWTNSMFGGMPGYQIAMPAPQILTLSIFKKICALWLPEPISYFFVACWCFYLLCMVLRLNPWIGIAGALAYSFSTYDPIIIAVGHVTKMEAIAYAPGLIAGLLLIFRKKYLTGAALLMFFMGLQTSTNHLQVIYYTGITAGIISVGYIINSIREKALVPAIKSAAVALAAVVIGFLTYAVYMLPTYDYAKETMRGGGSELTLNKDKANTTRGGLDKDYAFGYSVGIPETLTLTVPNIYGGGSDGRQFSGDAAFVQKLSEMGVPEESALQMANAYGYWGPQGPTAGPVYLGAVICFLFILSLFFTDGWLKWSLLAATLVSILLAWGKNFSALNYFLFDHLPFYNKFRAPSMSLVIAQFTFPLLGAIALDNIVKAGYKTEEVWKKFKQGLYVTGGLALVLVLFYFSQDFSGHNDAALRQNFSSQMLSSMSRGGQPTASMQEQASQVASELMAALRSDRKHIYGIDLLRSLILIGLAALLIYAFIKDKLKTNVVVLGLLLLSSFDLLAVGRRYLNDNNFVTKDDFESFFIPTAADQKIMADSSYFRVFDQSSGSPFMDASGARASYFHNSVGGYHAAKLALYQDLIDNQLSKGNMSVFNMLNTKYFIQQNPNTGQPDALLNTQAYGPCWLVSNLHFVKNADEEMLALDSINLRDTAVIQQQFAAVAGPQPQRDSTASIRFVANYNDSIRYQFSAAHPQFAVFSEIYYSRGWNAYIDGKKADYCKVDYLLRGLAIPAGDHEIEFRFEPASYKAGSIITQISSALTYLLLLAAAFVGWKRKQLV